MFGVEREGGRKLTSHSDFLMQQSAFMVKHEEQPLGRPWPSASSCYPCSVLGHSDQNKEGGEEGEQVSQ